MLPVMFGATAAVGTFLVDQATKSLILAHVATLSAGVPVFPGLNLVFLRNDGVTFGLLSGAPMWSLTALALAVCGWLVVALVRTNSRMEALAYGMIIGGALGNVADRLRHGAVTDFLDVYAGSLHWPAFNMADVFVVCGAMAVLFSSSTGARQRRAE
ncbi:signal peptidase II [Tranquillimonas alkanivorans]|uniref:Lipoprotein signal peptidase n=2 Tax=Tranquillimonas alkanivorans TaxID=441119 RepID=A0A1I5WX61_9RHOB|nr:signal peptidase II [Tranquillimonas alkanivorans]